MQDTTSTPPERRRARALFRGFQASLTRLFSRIVKKRDVDDLLQEAFTRSYETGSPSALRSYRAFLLKTAPHHAAANGGRANARLIAPVEGLPLAEVYRQLTAESPEAHLEANQRFMAFCRAVGGLPEHPRRAFVLKKVYGLSQEEIAERLGITRAEVELHIASGLLRCRDYLETIGSPLGGTDGAPDSRKSVPGPRR